MLVLFFGLTYAVTWAAFAGAGAIAPASPGWGWLRGPLLLLGTFAPGIVAIGLTGVLEGRPGLAALLRRLVAFEAKARWYLFAVGYLAAIKLAVAVLHRVAVGAWPRFGPDAWYLIAIATVASTPGQAGEEVGWRGFALPRLAERLGLARASVVLGVLWAAWHLPLFFLPGVDKYGQSFPLFLLEVTALSVAIAWLYAHTGGSLLLTMLMHSAVNQSVGIVPSVVPGATRVFALSPSTSAWLTVALLWATAAFFLARMPAAPAVLLRGSPG